MEPLTVMKYICEIIKRELSLADDQVYVFNQKYTIPADSRPYVSVALLSQKTFGSTLEYREENDGTMIEMTATNCQDTLSLNIYGRSVSVVNVQNDVIHALRSTYSNQCQLAYGFYIAIIPGQANNISEEEGTTILTRYNLPIVVQYFKEKEKPVDYYDKSSAELITEGE